MAFSAGLKRCELDKYISQKKNQYHGQSEESLDCLRMASELLVRCLADGLQVAERYEAKEHSNDAESNSSTGGES